MVCWQGDEIYDVRMRDLLGGTGGNHGRNGDSGGVRGNGDQDGKADV